MTETPETAEDLVREAEADVEALWAAFERTRDKVRRAKEILEGQSKPIKHLTEATKMSDLANFHARCVLSDARRLFDAAWLAAGSLDEPAHRDALQAVLGFATGKINEAEEILAGPESEQPSCQAAPA